MKRTLAILLLALLIFSCKDSEENSLAAPRTLSAQTDSAEGSSDEESSGGEPAPASIPPIKQKIIKEGNLRFETDDLPTTHSRVLRVVRKFGGLIQNDVEGKDYQSLFRKITVRIPNQNFDAFVSEVGKGIAYFDRKEVTARDVTEEFIDLDARLKAKKMLEERYLELLKKASKVSEMLEIEKQLAAVREEIEAKEGQLRYMESKISMSTVVIEFYTKTALEGGVTVSYGSKMWNAIKSGFNGISAFFIGILYIWPFIIILVVLIYFLRRRFKRKKTI
ncbi:MAG TPA: DUF4349 domain-containing protein [Flavobacterium sp.]